MPVVVYSKQDPAGINIADHLKESGFEVTAAEERLLYYDGDPQTDFVVFASRHRSKSGKPTFTVHATGNYGAAEYGGMPAQLSLTSARMIKILLKQIARNVLEDYAVSLEVTHHGPTDLRMPSAFIEIGSSEVQWSDREAAAFIAECIQNGIREYQEGKYLNDDTIPCIAFGGTHYAPKFTRYMLETNHATSHICPKYAADILTEDLIHQMITKTVESVETALIDWKGLRKQQRDNIINMLEKKGVTIERI